MEGFFGPGIILGYSIITRIEEISFVRLDGHAVYECKVALGSQVGGCRLKHPRMRAPASTKQTYGLELENGQGEEVILKTFVSSL